MRANSLGKEMNEILLNKDLRTARVKQTSALRAFWTAAIFPCFAGSGISFAAGMIVSILSWTGLIHTSRLVAYLAVGLLLMAFVLMFFGAHCMDRRDAAEKAERIEQSRREGLDVKDYTKSWER